MEWMILPLKRYAQFSGRSARREFWMWVLFLIIVTILLSILDKLLGLGGATQLGSETVSAPGMSGYSAGAGVRGGLLANVFQLAVLIPNIAVSVRRLHDINRSGWWILLPLVPYGLGAILVVAGLYGAGGMAVAAGLLMFAGFICAIVLLVWYCSRGTQGPNRFGPDPYAPIDDLHETFR